MEQVIIFYLLVFVITIVLINQYRQYLLKEKFSVQFIDGNVKLQQGVRVQVGEKNTEKDANVYSGGTLKVNKIRFRTDKGIIELNEDIFKRIKSFADIHNLKTDRGDTLCLKNKKGRQTCLDKQHLGILTGQTPFHFQLADKKPADDVNNTYPGIPGLVNETDKNTFFDHRFILLPSTMKLAGIPDQHGSYNESINDNIILKHVSKNYFCNFENKSPDVTLSNYELGFNL